jgi:carboxymethylenebutenolidase
MDIDCKEIMCAPGMDAFIAAPNSPHPLPVVVLMHERYGLVQHTRDQAIRCARDGYYVIAPNFFFRHNDQHSLHAGTARYDMSDPEAIDLMQVILDEVKKDRRADAQRIAVAGYCQTGRHPLVIAAHYPLTAVIIWYGAVSKREWGINERQPIALEDVIARLPCPVFAAFGALDHIISIDNVRHFRSVLEQHKKSYDIHIYDGAPHGWLNDTMPGRYRQAQAEAGWAAQQFFLDRVMNDAPPAQDHSAAISWKFECHFRADYDFSKNVRLE